MNNSKLIIIKIDQHSRKLSPEKKVGKSF